MPQRVPCVSQHCAGFSPLLLGRQDTKERQKLGLGAWASPQSQNTGNQDRRPSQPVSELLREARKSTRGWDTGSAVQDAMRCPMGRHGPLEHKRRLLWEGQHLQAPFAQQMHAHPNPGPDTISKWGHEVGHARTCKGMEGHGPKRCLSLSLTGPRK